MEQEKYGFVYIWYDCKHKRYYLGCHWGHEDDGYLCSSRWMRASYKRRPEDFKRRVISRVYTNKADLVEKEHDWLVLISEKELGKRYYNLRNHKFGHWSTKPDSRSVTEKSKETVATLFASMTPEERFERCGKHNVGRASKFKGRTFEEIYGPEKAAELRDIKIKNNTGKTDSEETRRKKSGRVPWNKGKQMTQEYRDKVSAVNKGTTWYTNGTINIHTRSDSIPEGFFPGRSMKKVSA